MFGLDNLSDIPEAEQGIHRDCGHIRPAEFEKAFIDLRQPLYKRMKKDRLAEFLAFI